MEIFFFVGGVWRFSSHVRVSIFTTWIYLIHPVSLLDKILMCLLHKVEEITPTTGSRFTSEMIAVYLLSSAGRMHTCSVKT